MLGLTFSNIVKELRGEKSYRQLSQELRVSPTTVRKWENRSFLPSEKSVIKLGKTLAWDEEKIEEVVQLIHKEYKSPYFLKLRSKPPEDRASSKTPGYIDRLLLRKLDIKYKAMADWPLDDPLVIEFRKKIGAIK